jgi:hypothetical protein
LEGIISFAAVYSLWDGGWGGGLISSQQEELLSKKSFLFCFLQRIKIILGHNFLGPGLAPVQYVLGIFVRKVYFCKKLLL